MERGTVSEKKFSLFFNLSPCMRLAYVCVHTFVQCLYVYMSMSSCPVIAVMICHPQRRALNGWSGMQWTHMSTHTCSPYKPCMNKLLSKLPEFRSLALKASELYSPSSRTIQIQHLKKPRLMINGSLNQPAATSLKLSDHFTSMPQHTVCTRLINQCCPDFCKSQSNLSRKREEKHL